MDPTTQSHLDPATLNVAAAGSDNIPVLVVNPTGTGVDDRPSDFSHAAPGYSASSQTGSTFSAPSQTGPAHTANPTASSQRASEIGSHSASSPPTSSSTSAKSTASSNPAITGLRQRVNSLSNQLDAASDHPAVKNAKDTANKQVGQFREVLGRSPLVRDLEKRTGVDRVLLVVGGVLAYFLIIPLNLFGLALPTTTLLTLVPPSFLALGILEEKQSEKSDAATRALLSYFVTLGFVQFLESLAAGLLERRIPQYYTVKLLFLAYLLHPRTQGAMKVHENIYKPLLARAQSPTPVTTPPQSKEFGSTASSPTFQAQHNTGGTTHLPSGPGSGVGLDVPKGVDASGNIVKQRGDGEGFSVVNQLH